MINNVVPDWSGSFTIQDDGLGVMAIYVGDDRPHQPPKGWSLLGEPEYEDDAEVWVCVAVN